MVFRSPPEDYAGGSQTNTCEVVMANEIRYSSNMSLVNGSLTDTYNTSGLTATQVTSGLLRNVQDVSDAFTGEKLDLGSLVGPRMAMFSNLDTANFVEVGLSISGDFCAFLKLKAGEQAGPLFLVTNDVWARSNTAPVKLFYVMYEA